MEDMPSCPNFKKCNNCDEDHITFDKNSTEYKFQKEILNTTSSVPVAFLPVPSSGTTDSNKKVVTKAPLTKNATSNKSVAVKSASNHKNHLVMLLKMLYWVKHHLYQI